MADFPRGRFAWHELLTTDTAAAQRFYKEVAGWGTMSWGEDAAYTLWTRRGEPVGGLMTLPDEAKQAGAPSNWMFYAAVPDADAAVRRATELGARVLVEVQEVPTVGRFAVLNDPQGACFAVLQPAGEVPGHDGEPRQGEISWHELVTTDPNAAWDFYRALFGWEKTESMDMGPLGLYQMYGRKGRTLGGIFRKPPEMPAPPHWLLYIKVASADTAVETVKRLGGQLLNGPMEVPGGSGDRIAQCMDPQGAVFAVHSVAAAAPARPKPKQATKKATRKSTKRTTTRAKSKTTRKRAKRAVKKAGTKRRR